MSDIHNPLTQLEVHDPIILTTARTVLEACRTPQEMQEAVLAAVAHNEEWRGRQCLNLLAPEAPTSPTVRALLTCTLTAMKQGLRRRARWEGLPGPGCAGCSAGRAHR